MKIYKIKLLVNFNDGGGEREVVSQVMSENDEIFLKWFEEEKEAILEDTEKNSYCSIKVISWWSEDISPEDWKKFLDWHYMRKIGIEIK